MFDFQETKNMMTGEGGMIVTDSPEYAKKCRLIRNHGESIPDEKWPDNDLENIVGMNYRMTELTAALGIAQLRKLPENNRVRIENANRIIEGVAGLEGLTVVPFPDNAVPHVLPLLHDEAETDVSRFEVLRALRSEGIPVGGGQDIVRAHHH